MTDSKTPGRKTLGIKTATSTSDAPRKPTRPVRVSDLNRKRVQDVVTGIKEARERAGERNKRKAAPAEGAARPDRADRGERPARPARPRPEGDRPPRRYGDDERRPPQRGFSGDDRRPPQRGAGGDDRPPRPRRFGDDEARPPRRYGDDERRPPQRGFSGDDRRPPQRGFSGDDRRPPQRSFGNDDRGAPRPRRFGDDEARPPRRYGDDERRPPQRGGFGGDDRRPPQRGFNSDDRRPPQRGFGNDDRGAPRPRRFGDDEARPPRRYGDDERRPPQRGGFGGDDRRPPQRGLGGDDRRPPQRSFGNDDRGAPRPRRFGDDEARPPRRYGDDERRPSQRGAGGDDTRRPAAPARRFSDTADRARPVRTERPAPRAEAREPVRQQAEANDDGLIRLSKRMSELGLCSRREADEWIPRGWVLVDGKAVTELGSRVRPDAEIEILQAARSEQGERVTVLINKPVGYVSGQAEDGYEPAAVLFAPENQWAEDPTRKRFQPWQRKNLAPAGRLDIDSTGLLVLTQDGRIARALIGDDSNVEKEYLVRVVWESPEGPVERNISAVFPADEIERLRHGLSLDGVPLKPAKVSWQNEEQLRFVLREGRKRQIRRMCEQVGLRVVGLKRVRMGRVVLGDLPPGQWRFLGAFEKF
ncbi:pseudouridine synthase [Cupriavidus sp. SIMBA_020]|uniref:pseudouridine synthase n=1 Tax=Cupriavidus sp. SIMBA_020 TaxID=3085766 RepID=UPI00397CA75C